MCALSCANAIVRLVLVSVWVNNASATEMTPRDRARVRNHAACEVVLRCQGKAQACRYLPAQPDVMEP